MLDHYQVKYQCWVIFCFNAHAKLYIKMTEIDNKSLLAGDKFMPKMYLKPPGFYLQCLWTIYKKQRKNSKI